MNRIARLFTPLALALLLAGCADTMQRIADCKAGDWPTIGHKDGAGGLPQNFADRREFCAGYDPNKPNANPGADYVAGWTQGNADFWRAIGNEDGVRALQMSSFEGRLQDLALQKKKTPPNRAAYEMGWLQGNSAYWVGLGKRDGTAGIALGQQDASRALAVSKNIRYDEAAYARGWDEGNRTFWSDAGFQDARNGVPDGALRTRVSAANAAGVRVREDAYHAAWDAEIVNYWSRLGAQDAVSGKDFAMRRAEAQRSGLKVFEAPYRKSWEDRLNAYWHDAGDQDGAGQPFLLEARISSAARDGVFVTARTRDIYTEAWSAQNARYCTLDKAFEAGRANGGMAIDVCPVALQHALHRALRNGRDYEDAAASRAAAQSDVERIMRHWKEDRKRLDSVEHDIHANQDNKARVINEQSAREDKQLGKEYHELIERMDHLIHDADEARHRAAQYDARMQHLRRESYQ